MVKAAQRLRFTLEEVADLLGGRGRPPPPPRRRAGERARVKLIEVEERVADLTVISDALRRTIEAGCADLVECARAGRCPIPFTPVFRSGHRAGSRQFPF
ncbi:MerR family DNA-binding protein [Actinocorallia sp. B10E7]|uniref:MerR family DNA-binding protein n=1 Tax=Actinocorallia sp. B10E7 TaxID=3153558 RepID=UPI00325CE6C9